MVDLRTVWSKNGYEYRRRIPDVNKDWYAFCRTVSSEGTLRIDSQTEFVGFSEVRPFRERRRASFVRADIWRERMSRLRELPLTVDDDASLLVWQLLGGEALVEDSFARKEMPENLEPYDCGRIAGDLGWHSTKNLPSSALRHAPTPKVCVEVILRDKRRCRLCGRSPDEDPHAFLEAHHGIPWGDSRSGLTVTENLFTLCNSCHKGVSNGLEQPSLRAIGVDSFGGTDDFRSEYFDGVLRYRKRALEWLQQRRRPSRRRK